MAAVSLTFIIGAFSINRRSGPTVVRGGCERFTANWIAYSCLLVTSIAGVGSLGLAFSMRVQAGAWIFFGGLGVIFSLLAILGFIDARRSYVEIHESHVVIQSIRKRRQIQKADIANVLTMGGYIVIIERSGKRSAFLGMAMKNSGRLISVLRQQ